MISEFSQIEFKKSIKKNVFYKLLANPSLYLKVLILRTFGIGLLILCIGLIVQFFDWDSYTIPSSMHSLIGIVIGLLLVFRTNTAYDRWWDGRKIIASLSSEVSLVSARLNVLPNSKLSYSHYNNQRAESIKLEVINFLKTLKNYLTTGHDNQQSGVFHMKQKDSLQTLFSQLSHLEMDDSGKTMLNASFCKMMEYSNQLERIKNTPIPLSYVFHIKISVLIYLLTLPFGMFHDLGLGAVPLVMLIYYIIAGVEIISSEIENPFAGDPNDLPTNKLFGVMIETLKT